MKSFRHWWIASFVLVLLFTASIARATDTWPPRDPAQPIVGRWTEDPSVSVIDFFPDGKLIAYSPVVGATGRWTVQNNNQITLIMQVDGEELSFQGTLSFIGDDKMRWDLEGLGPVVHRRFEHPLPSYQNASDADAAPSPPALTEPPH